MQDLRQTSQYARYLKLAGWQVYKFQKSKVKSQIFIKTIPFLGKFAKLQRPQSINFKILNKFIKDQKISVLYVEPLASEGRHVITPISPTFSLSRSAFLPSKTILIDLNKAEDQLLIDMHPKTRYNIKVAQRNGVIIKQATNIDLFIKLWHRSSLSWGNFLPQKKEIKNLWTAFGKKSDLLLAYKYSNDMHVHRLTVKQPLAGLLLCSSSNTVFYMYAAATAEGKKLFAPTLLIWEAIKLAKKKKLKYFDFEGIYDPRYLKQTRRWKGFTRFKQSFGGKVIEYPRTLVYYKNPLIKLLNI